MGRKCCVPNCRGNYDIQERVSVFTFPRNESRRRLWLNKIPKKNFKPKMEAVVCERHFHKDFVVRIDSVQRPDGTFLTVPREKPKLTRDAFPSIFPIKKDVDSPEDNAYFQEDQQSVDDEPPLDMSVRSVTPTPVPEETEKRTEQQAPRGRKRSLEDDLLYMVCQKLVSGHEKDQKDDFGTFGETVANDLRTMSREQFIHAKKLISDVLYEGTLNNLSRSSSLITVSETLSPRPRQNTDSVEDIPNCSNSHDQ